MIYLADIDTGAVLGAVGVTGGWLCFTALGVTLLYALAKRWVVTRGEYTEMRTDRDYYRKALQLERERADVASATVQRVLPASERAVTVLETIQRVTADQPLVINRGDVTP